MGGDVTKKENTNKAQTQIKYTFRIYRLRNVHFLFQLFLDYFLCIFRYESHSVYSLSSSRFALCFNSNPAMVRGPKTGKTLLN